MIESKNDRHLAATSIRPDGEIQVDCSCGAMWTHEKDTRQPQVQSIYESHLRYFNKPKMEVL